MGVYAFESKTSVVQSIPHAPFGYVEDSPSVPTRPADYPDLSKRQALVADPINTHPEDVQEVYQPGYRYLDEGMLRYFSEIRIPTNDSFRKMKVKIAGGDKSILIWQKDFDEGMREGRPILPVMSINRTGEQFNPMKFSPPYMPIEKRFATSDKTRLVLVYRQTPSLVNYQLTIWAEHKRDAEYALYDIRTRFNPLAEFDVEDGQCKGPIILRYDGMTDSSEKEAPANVRANVRYDLSVTAEAWLSLSNKLMPAILGHVTVFQEFTGEIFGSLIGYEWINPPSS
ncbi:MAG: hypothetical protein Q8K86_00280 [Candidatus Nanopelagicaceae bacterium]|nr:hypothetical protein [Candidatus Nanopelagicaceae bacterium]